MKQKLYIIGAGSVGGHVAINIDDYPGNYEIIGFFDDDPEKIGTKQFGYPVLGPVEKALDLKNDSVVIGIAFPKIKKQITELLSKNSSLTYPSLVHRFAWISKGVSTGNGSVIYPGTVVNYGSEIGNFVVMNMNCALGHHTHIGDFSSLAPGVNTGGHTIIGECTEIGIGASTLQEINIGENSTVGGQSMVIENVDPKSIVAGVPAKVIDSTK